MRGDILVDYDNNGIASYDGRTNIKDAAEAWKDAINSNAIEFVSEQMGMYFGPIFKGLSKATGAGLGKIGLGAVNKWVDDVAKKAYTPKIKEFLDATQFNGFLGEYGEEIAGGMMNAAIVGDMTIEDVFSKENLVDTALGLSVMSAVFPTIGAANYSATKRRERQNLEQAAANGEKRFGGAWGAIASVVENSADSKQLGSNLKKLFNTYGVDGVLPKDDLRAILNYATAYNRYNALSRVSQKAIEDGYTDADEQMLRESFDAGQAASTPEERNAIISDAGTAGDALATALGWDAEQLQTNIPDYDSGLELAARYENNGDADAAGKIREYIQRRAARDGVEDAYRTEQQRQIQESDARVDAITNKTTGMIVPAKLVTGEEVYITGGEIATTGEGQVDEELSDEQVFVLLPDGRVIPCAPDKIARIGETQFPDEVKEARRAEIERLTAGRFDADTATEDAASADLTIPENGNNAAENIPENGNIDTENIPTDTQEAEQQPSAFERVPKDEQGNPLYEQADTDTAWDAIVEQTEGDEAMAQTVADGMVADKEAALKKIEKAKAKGGVSIAEKIAAEKERKAAIDAAKQELDIWKKIAGTANRRKMAQQPVPVAENEMQPVQNVVDNNNTNALQNGNNNLNLQQENDTDNGNKDNTSVGGQISESVPQGEHRAQTAQAGGMEEAAARLRERIETDGRTPQTGVSRDVREVENSVTREYAQENGLWIPFEDVFKLGRPSKSGNEHDTYLNAEQRVIYKVNNRMNTPSILDLLDRMEQHNKYFPDNKYSLVGFTAVSENGDVWPVFAQEYVPDARMASVEEIDGYMGALGFTRVGDGRYSNGKVVIKDLKPRNVLADADGDVYVVDAEFEETKKNETAEPNADRLNQSGDNTEMGARSANEASKEVLAGRSLSQEEAQALIAEMESGAEVAPDIELNIDNWDALFGEDGTVNTPIGEVKMGENQFTKLMRQDRNGKLGMIKPTLENPDAIIEDKSKAKEGDTTERASSYVFVKAFKKADGTRYYYFTSVTVSKDNKEVVISNQEKRRNAIANLLVNGKLVWKHADNVSSASDVANGLYSSQVDSSELATEGTDAPQTNGTISTDVPSSEGESTASVSNSQENSVKSGENAQNGDENDVIEQLRKQNRVARERDLRAGGPPRPSDYSTAIANRDTEAMRLWEEKFNAYLQLLNADDLPAAESTIKGMQERKSMIKAGNPKSYKENPSYKAFDYIEKALKKRKRELEKSSINREKSQDIEDYSTDNGVATADEQVQAANVELQRYSLTLDRSNPAFETATERTMQALENTGVEVVMATEEQVNEVPGNEQAEMQAISDANERFNRELDAFKEKQHKGLLHLGRPMSVLSAAGVNARELTLSPKVLNRKMEQHSLTTDDLKGLAEAIQSPILVYKHGKEVPNLVVVTELDVKGGKLSIAIELDDVGNVVEINNVSSVHSKDAATELVRLANMGEEGLQSGLRWVEKEKVQDWLGVADLNRPIHTDNPKLISVANVINSFENPRIETEFHRVFHGSGAKFDRFDHSFMGTGEGSQFYGWGTYVTMVEGIGRTYATTMRDKAISDKHRENAIINNLARQVLASNNGDKNAALEELRNLLNESWSDKKRVKAEIKIIETGKFLPETKVKANLYTVEIPDDNGSNYLQWDEVVPDEAIDNLWNKLRNAYDEDVALNVSPKYGQSGEHLYKKLERALGGDKATSEFLSRAGFAGISYPAQATTGGREDGARNYVIFNENDAQITDRVEFLRTADGTVYGWSVGGKIYLAPEGVNPNTPVHEYTHLWAIGVERNSPKLWNRIVDSLRYSSLWNDVAVDEAYRDIWNDDSRMASEVLARLSGEENYRRTMQEAEEDIKAEDSLLGKIEKRSAWNSIKRAVRDFWNKVLEFAGMPVKGESDSDNPAWMEFVDMAIGDFYRSVNPNVTGNPLERMFIGERGATSLDKADEASARIENLSVAREMEQRFAEKKLRIEKLRASETIKITGDEIEPSEDMKQYKRNALEYGKSLRGEYTNADTGIKIAIGKNGIKEVLNHDYKNVEQLQSVAAIPQIIEKSTYIESVENEDVSRNKEVSNYHYYVCGLKIGGVDYTVRAVIAEQPNGERYYDHKLTQIEKGTLLDSLSGMTTPGFNQETSPVSAIKDKRLVSILQTNDKENARRIKLATGWERGADGKWRYETEDVKVKDIINIEGNEFKRREEDMLWTSGLLKDVIDAPGLFVAYPELENVRLDADPITGDYPSNGKYDPRRNMITIHADEVKYLNSILNHEIQHIIQHIEGFARGGNEKTGGDIESKARVWAWRNALLETGKEYPELAGTTALEQKLIDEYKADGLERYIPSDEQRIKGFNLYVRGYDNEGYEQAFNQVAKVISGNGFATYNRLAGEVESRNVQKRMGMSPAERRASLAEETADVARKDRIFIYDNLGESAMMGSRVDARMAEVAAHFDGKQLTAEQQAVVDVFGGKADNLTISVKTKDGNERKVVMRQGNEMGAGAKHSLYRHFGMNNGAITAGDITVIPEVLANGERTENKRGNTRLAVYRLTDDNGRRFTVVTQVKEKGEVFNDFYTNKKALNQTPQMPNGDTQLSARTNDLNASEDKGSENISNSQEDSDKLSAATRIADALGADVDFVTDVADVTDDNAALQARKRAAKGWYDSGKGRVVILIPNVENAQDAVETVLHEVVGHKGLRALFEERFNDMLDDVFDNGGSDVRTAIMRKLLSMTGRGERGDMLRIATEEYLAEQAERGFEDYSLWDRVKALFRDIMRRIGLEMEINDNEIRYMLWRSYMLQKNGNGAVQPDEKAQKELYRDNDEERQITERAKADGSYMKAPNGKPTNLNERQWVQVRTKAFKEWFGDWEKAAAETPIYKSKGTFANLAEAEIWAKENLQGRSRVNRFTGEEISISRKSVNEMLAPKFTKAINEHVHMSALQSVLDFIETGIPAEVHADTHGRGFDVMRLYNAIEIDGKVYRVKSTVRKVKEGDKFYTYEIQEMELLEDTQNTLGLLNAENGGQLNSNNSITGAKLLNGVKKTNSNEDILQYSKVIDENGEPMVVYHGTGNDFNYFEMQPGSLGNGAYFTSNWDEAAEYAMEKQGVEDIDELDDSKVKQVFLNVRDENQITHSRFSRYDMEILATYPNQIKSATDNVGTFSSNDNDIRFRDGLDITADTPGNLMEQIEAKLQANETDNKKRAAFYEQAKKDIKKLDDNKKKVDTLRRLAGKQKIFDKATVANATDIVKTLLDEMAEDGLTKAETKRILTQMKYSTSQKDLTKQVQLMIEQIALHRLGMLEKILEKRLRQATPKVNALGVPTVGTMDADGILFMSSFKEGRDMMPEDLMDEINETEQMMNSDDFKTAQNAAVRYHGLTMAREYIENIKVKEQEYNDLKKELSAVREGISRKAVREFRQEMQNVILDNIFDRISSFENLISGIDRNIGESKARVKEWYERERRRVEEIYHDANSDMQGRSASTTEQQNRWIVNLWPLRFLLKPLATFDELLRYFGSNSPGGKGHLWNRYMSGFHRASDKEWKNTRAAHKTLDDKASEVFGRKMKWRDLFAEVRRLPGMDVEFFDVGANDYVKRKLTQGNMLYIYMANKQADGAIKLRGMGITEDDVENIVKNLDPRFIEIADWLQDDFLKERRKEYNRVHERLHGVPMADIENYFPLVINKRSLNRKEDVGLPDRDNELPSTTARAWIQRVRNTRALDITRADAFDVVLGHLKEMEHIAAFAEFNRDLNTLINYKRFRNKVLNSSSVRFGQGAELWKTFKDCCRMAAGSYRPEGQGTVGDLLASASGNLTRAKIAFRLITAMKQILSLPQFLPFINTPYAVPVLLKNLLRISTFKWANETLPGFAERWQSGRMGDTRLKNNDNDFSWTLERIYEKSAQLGMTPNVFIDAMSCAAGARSHEVYVLVAVNSLISLSLLHFIYVILIRLKYGINFCQTTILLQKII